MNGQLKSDPHSRTHSHSSESEKSLSDVSFIPCQSSIPANEAIGAVVKAEFGLKGDVRCEFFRRGLNDLYRIDHVGGSAFFRLSRPEWRTLEELEAEAAILHRLASDEISAPIPLFLASGKAAIQIRAPEGFRYGMLFPSLGKPVDRLDRLTCSRLGLLLGKIHNALSECAEKRDRLTINEEYFKDVPLKALRHYAYEAKSEREYRQLIKQGEILSQHLSKLSFNLTIGFCHGDVNKSNLRLIPDRRLALLDFDCSGSGPLAFDLGLMHRSIHGEFSNRKDRREALKALLDGYSKVGILNDADLKAIPVYAALSHFWEMGQQSDPYVVRYFGVNRFTQRYFKEAVNTVKDYIQDYL